MKLQNLTVIFIIIILPIILVTSYYMSLQINTINMQTAYDTKLLESTKSAIEAYEINTVDWNPDYSQHPDSQRRDVMASIDSFTTSFANSLGVSGTNKENILPYIPAIAYTLYDGYYIYTPSRVAKTIKDDNGVTVTLREDLVGAGKPITLAGTFDRNDEGKVLYEVEDGKTVDGTYNGARFTLDPTDAKTDYKHILKPFAAYSKKYVTKNGREVVVSYTLDNYVKIYGQESDVEGGLKEGYITGRVTLGATKSVNGIKHGNKEVNPEILTENIAYYTETKDGAGRVISRDDVEMHTNVKYVYEAGNKTKVYIDDYSTDPNLYGKVFVIEEKNGEYLRVDLSQEKTYFKKVTIPITSGGTSTYREIYQDLVTRTWYKKMFNTEVTERTIEELTPTEFATYVGVRPEIQYDYSGINYCVESAIFTAWATSLGLKNENGEEFFVGDVEKEGSLFNLEKREVIKDELMENLGQSITSYSRYSAEEYSLPVLSETDWDQILTNVSIITFVQEIPIGMKYYNNYAIATSTLNREYVDPNEIYINARNDDFYHRTRLKKEAVSSVSDEREYCQHLSSTDNVIGYRNIDYVAKQYQTSASGTEETKYYYRHALNKSYNSDPGIVSTINENTAEQSCYYCLIQRDLFENGSEAVQAKAYYTALARERYVAKKIKIPSEVEPTYYIHVTPVDASSPGDVLGGARWSYTLNGGAPTNVVGERDNLKIEKGNVPGVYEIKADSTGSLSAIATEIGGLGTLDAPETATTPFTSPTGSDTSSKSKVNVNLNTYNYAGLSFSMTDIEDVIWGYRCCRCSLFK